MAAGGGSAYKHPMAYDEDLADRIRGAVGTRDVTEKKMFGGLAFLVGGNMAVAASGQGGLMLRCAPEETDEHLAAGAEEMVMRGKAMRGWLRVPDAGLDDGALQRWVDVGMEYAASLPAK